MRGTDRVVGPAGFVHRAGMFDSVDQAGEIATDLLGGALHRGREPVLAVLPPEVRDAVRVRLGDGADAVAFLAPRAGRSAGSVVWEHLEARPAGRGRPFVVTCGLPDADPYGSLCLETEVLANRLLADLDEEHTCLYPRSERLAHVARLSHPLLREDGDDRANPAYRAPEWLALHEPAVAHLDLDAVVRDVLPHVDPDLRAWLADHARSLGLPGEVVEQVVLAGHEALRAGAESRTATVHGELRVTGTLGVARPDTDGLPSTRLYLHRGERDELVLDVDSAWLPPIRSTRLPAADAVKGLWLANAACRDVAVSVHPLTPERARIRVRVDGTG